MTTGLVIPEKCMNCKLSLETIRDCIDCLRVKAGLSKVSDEVIKEILR